MHIRVEKYPPVIAVHECLYVACIPITHGIFSYGNLHCPKYLTRWQINQIGIIAWNCRSSSSNFRIKIFRSRSCTREIGYKKIHLRATDNDHHVSDRERVCGHLLVWRLTASKALENSVQKYNDRSIKTRGHAVLPVVDYHYSPSVWPVAEVVRIAGSLISPRAKTTGPLELTIVPMSVEIANTGKFLEDQSDQVTKFWSW